MISYVADYSKPQPQSGTGDLTQFKRCCRQAAAAAAAAAATATAVNSRRLNGVSGWRSVHRRRS